MKSTTTELPQLPDTSHGGSPEEALRISQAQVQALFEAAPMGIFLLDADFRICQVNPAARPAFGDIPDLIGKDFDDVMHILWEKEYADEVVKIYRHTLETGEPFYTPERIEKRLDRGVIEVYEWRLNRILMPDGRFGVVCYFRDVSQQVLARMAVEESEQRMRLITDSIPGLIAYVDSQLRYRFVNIAYEQWFGHHRNEVVGKHLWEVLGETAYRSLLPKIERVSAGEDLHFEQWVPYKDGGSRFVKISYLPDKQANGEVLGYFALIIDITERYRHERKMNSLVELSDLIRRAERVEELLKGVCEITAKHFEVSHCIFCEIDLANNLSEVKIEYRNWEKPSTLGTYFLSDYPQEQVSAHLKGQPVVVEDAKNHPVTQPIYKEAFEPFGFNSFISQPVLRNGVWVGLLCINHSEPRHWGEEQVHFLGIVAERTFTAVEKLRSEESLRESESRFRTLADSAPVLIWVNGADGGCQFVNKAYLDFFGKTMEEVQGFGWTPSLHPEDEQKYLDAYKGAYDARFPFHCQARIKNKKGEYRWVNSTGMPRFSASGEFLGYVGVSPDITEIKLAEEALLKKNKELEQLSYITSHDLQEPVNTISGYLNLLESELHLDGSQYQYFQFIKASCQRMNQLISDLLQHSRIGSSSQPQRVEIQQLVHEVLLDMDGSVKAKSAVIQVGELPVLTAYPTEMRLLFQNLLSNAMKFQKAGGKPQISITASPESLGNGWHFIVADNGIGIEAKYHERIFTIFQRLHSAHEFDGTGIGLAHCRKIVELHRGKIWVESELGKGSRFHFVIREPN